MCRLAVRAKGAKIVFGRSVVFRIVPCVISHQDGPFLAEITDVDVGLLGHVAGLGVDGCWFYLVSDCYTMKSHETGEKSLQLRCVVGFECLWVQSCRSEL